MNIVSTVKHRTSPGSDEMILSFLKNHPQGALTTLSKANTLQSSVVTMYCIDDYEFVFLTKKQTRKNKNLHINPSLAFITYDVFSQTELEIEGLAQVIDDPERQHEALDVIKRDAEKGRWHISPYVSDKDEYVMFAIYPRRIHLTTYWNHKTNATVYHEVIEFDVRMD